MHFTYQGFTHEGDIRCFTFHGVKERETAAVFSINISLLLFARHHVLMQEAPTICLNLLTAASELGSGALNKLQQYRVVEEDLRPLLVDREQRAALKALKSSTRKFVRKPPVTSQFRGLGIPAQG